MADHPYEGAATARAREDGISDSEAQMLARRLAEAKQRIEELKGYKEAAIKAMSLLFKCTPEIQKVGEMERAYEALMTLKWQCQTEYDAPIDAIKDVRARTEDGQS